MACDIMAVLHGVPSYAAGLKTDPHYVLAGFESQ
jgi:hypothetical protein